MPRLALINAHIFRQSFNKNSKKNVEIVGNSYQKNRACFNNGRARENLDTKH